jgi:glutamate racemase
VEVLTEVGAGLVEAVEQGELDTPETEALLRRHIEPLLDTGADQLVLGCTHYPFLRPAIERIVDGRMAVIDPAPAVARQTVRVLTRLDLEASPDRAGRHIFYTTGDPLPLGLTVTRLLPTEGDGPHVVRAARWREGRLEALP